MKKDNVETVEQVCECSTKTNGGMGAKIAAGAIGILAVIGTALLYKKNRDNKLSTEDIEVSEEN